MSLKQSKICLVPLPDTCLTFLTPFNVCFYQDSSFQIMHFLMAFRIYDSPVWAPFHLTAPF